jgi:ribokinase
MLAALGERLPDTRVVLTLGEHGVVYRDRTSENAVPAYRVQAIDSTGAGDTFIGYFLAGLMEGMQTKAALELGCRAAAVCVTRPGAMDSIPRRAELTVLR